jgi:ABC-2 type transport system permease protein
MGVKMLSNVFLKTIYEKRWMMLGWGLATALFSLFIVLVYPVFRDAFGESMAQIPESLQGFIGDKANYQTLDGFVDIQVIYQMVFMPVIMGIILFSGLIAGKHDQGVLQSLLVQPIKRSRVYIDMLLASVVIIGIVTFTIFVFTWIGALIISEPIDLNRLLQATVATWLVSLVVGVLAYAVGAVTLKRGFAGTIAGIVFFVSYIITSLAPSVDYLRIPNYFSFFKYFNTPSVMLQGIRLSNVLVLIGISVVLSIIGFLIFVKRDIPQN